MSAEDRARAVAAARADMQYGWATAPANVRALLDEVDEVTADRDRARAIAVALEQRIARALDVLDMDYGDSLWDVRAAARRALTEDGPIWDDAT